MSEEKKEFTKDEIKDAQTLLGILMRRKSWIAGLVALVTSTSGAATWAYNHFAKQTDLVIQVCERQAIDMDMGIAIDKSRNETLIEFSTAIIDMFKQIDPNQESQTTRIWLEKFRDLKDKHVELLAELNDKPNFFTPTVINKCVNSDPPIIEDSEEIDELLEMLGRNQ